jgi:hypothetical protein
MEKLRFIGILAYPKITKKKLKKDKKISGYKIITNQEREKERDKEKVKKKEKRTLGLKTADCDVIKDGEFRSHKRTNTNTTEATHRQ